jgi:hypothetical protein
MKRLRSLLLISALLVSQFSFAEESFNLDSLSCTGQAESGTFAIYSLQVQSGQIVLIYSLAAGGKPITKRYIVTEKMRNGSTDVHQDAYFIAGTASGKVRDQESIELPHLGQYAAGLGSDVAFNDGYRRVYGTVLCR